MTDKDKLNDIITAMQGQPVLVIGDMVADVYLDGRISRISREAPVLVLEQAGERVVAGGAANVVNNATTLGGHVYAAGVLGQDATADKLRDILAQNGADIAGLISVAGRPTSSKTRIIAGGRATVSQQIVRVDRESHEPLDEAAERQLMDYVDNVLPEVRGIVISDYGTGTVTPAIKDKLIGYARQHGLPSIVDSRYAVREFAGIGYVKQNDAEIAAALGRELHNTEEIVAAGRELQQELDADGVLVTRGEQGMTLVERSGAVTHIPVSDVSEVFDVSGAGDTCVATVILALAAGVPAPEAATLSNIASGIAVRKLGTATVTAQELRKAVAQQKG